MGADRNGRLKTTHPWVSASPTLADALVPDDRVRIFEDPWVAKAETLPMAANLALRLAKVKIPSELKKRFRDYVQDETLKKRRKLAVVPFPADTVASGVWSSSSSSRRAPGQDPAPKAEPKAASKSAARRQRRRELGAQYR